MSAPSPPRFFVDGASDDPTDLKIPLDPLRFHPKSQATPFDAAMRSWDHYAQMTLGRLVMQEIRRIDMVLVPRETWERALDIVGVQRVRRTRVQSPSELAMSQMSSLSSQDDSPE